MKSTIKIFSTDEEPVKYGAEINGKFHTYDNFRDLLYAICNLYGEPLYEKEYKQCTE